MKSLKLFLILFVLGAIVSSFSSNDKDEARYSCDDGVNDFIVENIDFVSSMSRETASNYKLSTMKSIYRTWDNYKVESAWRDKLQQDAQHFEGEKKEFILEAYNSNPPKDKIIKLFGEDVGRNIFVNLKTLKEQGYDRSKLLAINKPRVNNLPQPEGNTGGSSAGETQGDYGGWGNGGNPTGGGERDPEGGSTSSGGEGESDGNCDCSNAHDWCPTYCGGLSSGCEVSGWGCGLFWQYSCDGGCV